MPLRKPDITRSKVQEDHGKFNYVIPYPNVRKFELAIEYILDDEDLIVRIPGESIVYPVDVMDYATGNKVTSAFDNHRGFTLF